MTTNPRYMDLKISELPCFIIHFLKNFLCSTLLDPLLKLTPIDNPFYRIILDPPMSCHFYLIPGRMGTGSGKSDRLGTCLIFFRSHSCPAVLNGHKIAKKKTGLQTSYYRKRRNRNDFCVISAV